MCSSTAKPNWSMQTTGFVTSPGVTVMGDERSSVSSCVTANVAYAYRAWWLVMAAPCRAICRSSPATGGDMVPKPTRRFLDACRRRVTARLSRWLLSQARYTWSVLTKFSICLDSKGFISILLLLRPTAWSPRLERARSMQSREITSMVCPRSYCGVSSSLIAKGACFEFP